jgi:hypothetical protein
VLTYWEGNYSQKWCPSQGSRVGAGVSFPTAGAQGFNGKGQQLLNANS